MPFLYLEPYTQGQLGVYAAVPVYGASDWVASWIGLPVQWVGLVYRSSIQRLSLYDSGSPWDQIAKGITTTGLKMT